MNLFHISRRNLSSNADWGRDDLQKNYKLYIAEGLFSFKSIFKRQQINSRDSTVLKSMEH